MTILGVQTQSITPHTNDLIILGSVFAVIVLALAVLWCFPCSLAYRSLMFALLSAAIVVFVIWWNPYRLIEINGHEKLIGYGVWVLLFGLALTHFMLLVIMWVQRKGLWPSEAAMFRWTAIKTIFWASSAYFFRPQAYGAPLINLVVFTLIFITTLDLDVRIFRRYILGAEQEHPPQDES